MLVFLTTHTHTHNHTHNTHTTTPTPHPLHPPPPKPTPAHLGREDVEIQAILSACQVESQVGIKGRSDGGLGAHGGGAGGVTDARPRPTDLRLAEPQVSWPHPQQFVQ